MKQNNKEYGFTISLHEIHATIPSLWPLSRYFAYKEGLTDTPLLKFFTDENGDYNGCHFWSNFEIARVGLWNSELYLKYFDFLDKWGGFFYERWGDAPVHSIFVGLALRKDQVHFFNDIGYQHEDFGRCTELGQLSKVCICPEHEYWDNFDFSGPSCLQRWLDYNDTKWTFGDPL
ncbi:alpha 1,2-mannosyltransferase 2.4.1 [Blyttiomyces sp. JEL0837]|nr:alpha 1,2-mannosyltransferase 2.4.1 [Blyttiomyces sp. JEL0837]